MGRVPTGFSGAYKFGLGRKGSRLWSDFRPKVVESKTSYRWWLQRIVVCSFWVDQSFESEIELKRQSLGKEPPVAPPEPDMVQNGV